MSSPETENAESAVAEAEGPKKLNLDVKVDAPSSCQRHVTVTVSREDIDRYFDVAIEDMVPNAAVPGFRKGNAPKKLVEKRFRSEVKDQVKGTLLMDSMTQATEEQSFSAISEPDFNYSAIELPEDGELTFEFDIEVRPEFDLPKWKGLKLEKPTRGFEKEDIDKHLKQVLGRYASLVPHEGAAEIDDHLVCNLTFKHDGKKIEYAEEESIRLRDTLSFQDAKWEDFGKEMTGAKAGDKKTVTLTISDEAANEAMRGKQVEMEIEVLEVKRTELPEMDEAFLKQIGGFESEGDLRDYVKQDMERQLNYYQQQRLRQQITEELTKDANWELPPALLKRQSARELERAVMELRSAGFAEEDIQAHRNELRQNSMASTRKALKEHFILERIAEEENVEDSQQDYDLEVMQIAMQRGESPRRIRAQLEKGGMMDVLRNQIIERKVIELIQGEATVTEVDADLQQSKTSAVNLLICGEGEEAAPAAEEEAKDAE
ncbi:trigger factor [Blastopirellula marina]|uniref:Trigger factor n=1 Tax=Blastopirellula marina TaxID=124 RepID=A0A2S8FG73_9BACT|nr:MULTISPECIES: trigger factor [Pirellulaceae]PQO31178.1 trigger factor [Blastopirellula marina]RCS51572.1 trigger factor [Bremerella cremea]